MLYSSHDKPSEAIRDTWIQSLVETFWYIYSRKILHLDVEINNILVKNGSLKVIDANAAMYVLDADMKDLRQRSIVTSRHTRPWMYHLFDRSMAGLLL